MTQPAKTIIHGSLHQRLYTGWIRRQNPFLEPHNTPPFIIFAWGFATAMAICAVLLWVTMR